MSTWERDFEGWWYSIYLRFYKSLSPKQAARLAWLEWVRRSSTGDDR